MPLNYSMVNKRFDFAVPLEDIFTNGGIHPRLKFIFQQTFELYLGSPLNITQALQEGCCLSKCLELKQKIINANQPGIYSQYSPPSEFFWIIRHFLGLLPISLLPAATNDQKFPWKELSKQCKQFFRYKPTDEEFHLNYSIARTLNNLPLEHVSLLNTLVIFIREISKKKLCKGTLKNLAQYYCDAVFVRPFQPGHKKDQTLLPLFIYIITRWYRILRYLKIDNINTFHYQTGDIVLDLNKNYSSVNSSTQTNNFVSGLWNVPFTSVKYLKDVECQTEDGTDNINVNFNQNDTLVKNKLISTVDDNHTANNCSREEAVSLKTFTDHFNDTLTKNKLISTAIDNQTANNCSREEVVSLKTFTDHLNERKTSSFVGSLMNIYENEPIIQCQRCLKFDFFDDVVNERNNNWNEVVQEVAKTVKRVEEQNYETEGIQFQSDDNSNFDTFESTVDSESTSDTVYNTFKDSTLNGNNVENSQNTFSFKSLKDVSQGDTNARSRKKNKNVSLYKSFYESDEELYNTNGEKSTKLEEVEDLNRSNFNLSKFKIKCNFLRSFSPKLKKPRSFRCILAGKIKYMKIKN